MSTTPPLSDQELQAYVDDRLSPQRRAEIEHYLTVHPDLADKARIYQMQNQLLHGLFDRIREEPIPERLTHIVKAQSQWRYYRAAAAMVWLVVGGLGGYLLRGEVVTTVTVAEPFTERAAVAHVVYSAEVLHPVEVGADQEAHLVQWLSKRLGHPLRTPDLTRFGYQLVGGRLLPGDKGAAAQFMYQNSIGARLTLYVTVKDVGTEQTGFRMDQEDGQQVMYWVDNTLGFALVGEKDRKQLLEIARATYQAMSF
ncbi:MAG: anti-sigma factor [Gammaproteobacteria bacterium]|nr:anti-sigma factor [Gammaproteobacteria bacterium]